MNMEIEHVPREQRPAFAFVPSGRFSSGKFFQSSTVDFVLRRRHQSLIPRYSGFCGYRSRRYAVYLCCVRVQEGRVAAGIVEACGESCEQRGAGELREFAGCAVEGFVEGGVLCLLAESILKLRCTCHFLFFGVWL